MNGSSPEALGGRLKARTDAFATAACRDLGFPITFVQEQIGFASSAIEAIPESWVARPTSVTTEVAFLFPSNTEGAMPAYLIALSALRGARVHVKLSRGGDRIASCLKDLFADLPQVLFYDGSGASFLEAMFKTPEVKLIQVFGDDSWIGAYEKSVMSTRKTLAFEGPGKDPVLILPGADLEVAVKGVVDTGLFAGGAACMSPERYIVHVDQVEEFTARLVGCLESISPLPPDYPTARLGYLYSERAVDRLQKQVDDAVLGGANVELQSPITPVEFSGREFHSCGPIVLSGVLPHMSIVQDETFGPVFPIVPFQEVPKAIEIAEGTRYGLTATVFGPHQMAKAVAAQLERCHGVVYTNTTMLESFEPAYWGAGGHKQSGWIWSTDGEGGLITRRGFRDFRDELDRALFPEQEGQE